MSKQYNRREVLKGLGAAGTGLTINDLNKFTKSKLMLGDEILKKWPNPDKKEFEHRTGKYKDIYSQSTLLAFFGAYWKEPRDAWTFDFRLATAASARRKDYWNGELEKKYSIDQNFFNIIPDGKEIEITGYESPQYWGVQPAPKSTNYEKITRTIFETVVGELPGVDYALAAPKIVDAMGNSNDLEKPRSGVKMNRDYAGFWGLNYKSDVSHYIRFEAEVHRDSDHYSLVNINSGVRDEIGDTMTESGYHIYLSKDKNKEIEPNSRRKLQPPETINPNEMSKEQKRNWGIKKVPASKSKLIKESSDYLASKNEDVYIATNPPLKVETNGSKN